MTFIEQFSNCAEAFQISVCMLVLHKIRPSPLWPMCVWFCLWNSVPDRIKSFAENNANNPATTVTCSLPFFPASERIFWLLIFTLLKAKEFDIWCLALWKKKLFPFTFIDSLSYFFINHVSNCLSLSISIVSRTSRKVPVMGISHWLQPTVTYRLFLKIICHSCVKRKK